MSDAINAPMNGKAVPMIVMFHGTAGSYLGHFDTASALADAGFVVLAMNHTGDNHADQSHSVDIMDRPRQVSCVIDHMLSTWEGVRRSTRRASACSVFPQVDLSRS